MQFDLQVFFIIFSALFVPRTQKATSSRFLSPGAIQSASGHVPRGAERVKKYFDTLSNGKRFAGFPFEKACILLRA